MATHFFVNFAIFKWLYLAFFWVYLHQPGDFVSLVCTLWLCGSIVANPLIYRLVPSPSRFENRQWLMTTWNKQRSTILVQKDHRSAITRRTKYQELWKGLYVNCCDFFFAGDFVGRIGIMLLNFTPLRSPDIFYNHVSRSQKGEILRWNRHAGQQAEFASSRSECSLPADKWKTEGQNAHSSWL